MVSFALAFLAFMGEKAEYLRGHADSNVPDARAIILKPSSLADQSDVSFSRWTNEEIIEIYHALSRRTLPEIAIKVIDDAEYWQVHKAFRWGKNQSRQLDMARPRSPENSLVLSLYSDQFEGPGQSPLRRVIVRTLSRCEAPNGARGAATVDLHDSHTWFDIVLQRFCGEENIWKDVIRRKLWDNVSTYGRLVFHVGSLECGEEIVDNGMKGDRIVVCAFTEPGWFCEITKVELWTFTAVPWSGLS
jgi:hypothetical protein